MSASILVQEFANQLGQSLEMMSGEKPAIVIAGPDGQTPATGDPTWEQPFNTDGTCAWLSTRPDEWTLMGGALLRAAGIEEYEEEAARGTFTEVLSQAFSGTGRTFTTQLQRDLNTGTGRMAGSVPAGITWERVEVRLGTAVSSLLVGFSETLLGLLLSSTNAAIPAETKESVPAKAASPAVENSRTLELLLDVELPVSVSFGRAHLALKDVIKLTTGSIVELNRTISEPVEVIVNNCVIARGEVVVVEGNFGVRIHEVISKQDRLRTLY